MFIFRSIIAAAAAALIATGANAEFLKFDDTSAGKITVTANGFEYSPFEVNGKVFNSQEFQDVSFDFAKGSVLKFSGTFFARDLTDVDSIYQFVGPDDVTKVLAQLEVNRSIVRLMRDDGEPGEEVQQIEGSYRGSESGPFAVSGMARTFVMGMDPDDFNETRALGVSFFSSNLLTSVGAPVAGPVAGAVPEPASWALMIGGIGMVGGAMRRRTVSAKVAVA